MPDKQLPAELNEIVRSDKVEEIKVVQAILQVKLEYNCNHNNFTKKNFIEPAVDLPGEPKDKNTHIPSFVNIKKKMLHGCLHFNLLLCDY